MGFNASIRPKQQLKAFSEPLLSCCDCFHKRNDHHLLGLTCYHDHAFLPPMRIIYFGRIDVG